MTTRITAANQYMQKSRNDERAEGPATPKYGLSQFALPPERRCFAACQAFDAALACSCRNHPAGGDIMDKINLSAPTTPIFLISLVLAVLALLGKLVVLPFITIYGFWLALIAFIVLAGGCLLKGA
jgi:hypothetical protein